MRIHKLLPLALLAGAATFYLTGCTAHEETTGTNAPPASKPLTLAFVTNNAGPFWTIAHKGCDDGAKEAGNVTVDFRIPSDASAATQTQYLNDLAAKGVDGIAVSPIDPPNETELLNTIAGKTLLITQDSDAPASNRACYIGTNNVLAGEAAGALLKEALPNGGDVIMFVGKKDSQNAKERIEGIMKAIAGTKINVKDIRTDDADMTRAKANAADALVREPNIAALVGLYSYNGPAIYGAVTEANAVGKVKIVCFDEQDETLAGVAAGAIYGTVVQQPYEFGRMAITLMAKYARGDKSAFPANKVIIVPTISLKQADVAAFQTKLKAMLGK